VLITCTECGRAVSSRAPACIGCGAPIVPPGHVVEDPQPEPAAPPARAQIKLRAIIASAMLVTGVVWATLLDKGPGRNRFEDLMAAILIIGGLCSLLVTLIQAVAARDR